MQPETITPAAIAASVVFDERILTEAASGSRTEARELVSMFFSLTDAAFREMQEALQRGDLDVLRRLAHRAAGSAATCGLPRLMLSLRAVEQAPDQPGAAAALQTAEPVYREARSALVRFVRTEAIP